MRRVELFRNEQVACQAWLAVFAADSCAGAPRRRTILWHVRCFGAGAPWAHRAALAASARLAHNPPPAVSQSRPVAPMSSSIADPSRPPRPTDTEPPGTQPRLDLDPEGVRRIVWQGRYGAILIEVLDDQVLVNGERVEPACLPPIARG